MTAVEAASTPASPNVIGLLIIAVTSEYFVGEKPVVVRDLVNAMWLTHLAEFPEWAIRNAVTWWVGPDNKDRRRRPVPGDIAERCKAEVACITAASENVRRWEKYRGDYPSFLTAAGQKK